MKKFYVMASMLGLGMLGLAGVTPTLVSASDVTSNGQVKFKLDQSQTDPKNPLDPADKNPGKPTDPTQPGGKVPGGTGGPLSIDFASSLIFGEAEISHEDATYYAKPQTFTQDDGTTVDRPNFIQVTDKRGTFEGWTLKVKQENQFAVKDDPTKELTGAQLSFTNGNLVSSTDAQYAPKFQKSFDLIPGQAQIAPVEAAADQGMGTWIYRFGDDKDMAKSIALSVPGKTPKMAKAYTTALTWSLESTPANTTSTPGTTSTPSTTGTTKP